MRTREVEELFVEPPPRFAMRRWLLALLAICAVAGIATIAIVARSRPDALAQLRIREPGVTVLHGTTAQREGAEGQDLGEGDVVRTDGAGKAQIDLFDGSLVRLDSDSEVSLRNLEDASGGRAISLGLLRGRAWHRVADQQGGDSYEVDLGEAVVTAVGTTFLTDCTEDPVCYVLGVEDAAVVESTSGREVEVEEGDCVEVDPSGRLERCDPGDVMDAWVRGNLAEDEQLTFSTAPQTPSPSPTATASVRPRSVRRPVTGGPVRTAAPTATPAPTRLPTDEPPPRTDPPDTPRPTDPVETPFDEPRGSHPLDDT